MSDLGQTETHWLSRMGEDLGADFLLFLKTQLLLNRVNRQTTDRNTLEG
jgi:hypothetical protein